MEAPWLNENLSEVIRSDDNILSKCCDMAKDIMGSKLKLVTLVERLGNALTDKDSHVRFMGTDVLAEVLHNLPNDFLIEAELHFMIAFFIDRLADHHSVTPAVLKGILSVVQMEHVPSDSAKRIVHALFQHVQCQTLKPEDRRKMYTIFQYLMRNFAADLQTLGPDFTYGLMNAVDQEKDARNLLIVFRMIPYFVATFELGHLKEEMFEIISCYFPVDYRPDYSNCPVSREDLAESLQKCLVASPDFGEFCLPLLIEKLDSKLKLAKLDSFKVLIAGCEIFKFETIKAYLLDLWRIIQHEVLPGSDKDVRKLGLHSLRAIVMRFSQEAAATQNIIILKSVTQFILNAGINSLGEVELNLFLPAVRMMLTAAEASSVSCQEVSQRVLPVLIKQYYQENQKEQKVTVLRALTSFIAVCDSKNVLLARYSDSVSQDICSLFLGAAQSEHPEVRREGFHGLAVSVKAVDEKNRAIAYDLLKKSLNDEDHTLVREEILVCLKQYSKVYSSEVLDRIVEVKLREIQLWPDGVDENLFPLLQSLCSIADEDPFTALVIPSIFQLIVESCSFQKCSVAAKCLRNLLESCSDPKIFNYMCFQYDVVSRLTLWWLQGLGEEKYSDFIENEGILSDIAKIITIIVRNQESSVQKQMVTAIVPQILNHYYSSANGSLCEGFDLQAPSKYNLKVVLLEALLSSLHLDVTIPHFHKLVIDLIVLALFASHALIQQSACRLATNLVNKVPEDETLLTLLNEILFKCKSIVVDNNSPDFQQRNATNVMVWITKALVMRGHSEMNNWIGNLLTFMAKPFIGNVAAQGFSIILKEDLEYLNLYSFCNIRILFRQRFFSFTPKLIEAFHNASEDAKANYLIALGHMLQGVPQEVLLMELEKMVPLLIESLQQTDETLLMTTLETLLSVLQKSKLALQHHLQTFIPRILTLTQFHNSMNVRIKAMQCIYQFSKYPTDLILPFKKQVLKVLGECLDDHKRLVRKEVVSARSQWFLVGSNRRRLV